MVTDNLLSLKHFDWQHSTYFLTNMHILVRKHCMQVMHNNIPIISDFLSVSYLAKTEINMCTGAETGGTVEGNPVSKSKVGHEKQ